MILNSHAMPKSLAIANYRFECHNCTLDIIFTFLFKPTFRTYVQTHRSFVRSDLLILNLLADYVATNNLNRHRTELQPLLDVDSQ